MRSCGAKSAMRPPAATMVRLGPCTLNFELLTMTPRRYVDGDAHESHSGTQYHVGVRAAVDLQLRNIPPDRAPDVSYGASLTSRAADKCSTARLIRQTFGDTSTSVTIAMMKTATKTLMTAPRRCLLLWSMGLGVLPPNSHAARTHSKLTKTITSNAIKSESLKSGATDSTGTAFDPASAGSDPAGTDSSRFIAVTACVYGRQRNAHSPRRMVARQFVCGRAISNVGVDQTPYSARQRPTSAA